MVSFFKKFSLSPEILLTKLRNLKIRYRLIFSFLFSTLFPLLVVYLYSLFLFGNSEPAGRLLIMCILLMCVPLILTASTYFSISSPIRHMIKTCQSVAEGNLEVRIQDSANDELAFLSDNIDGMITKIQLLLEQRQESETKKRELELKILQYQINPHFLFNTLNTLRLVALMNHDKVVSEGILSLSELLKNTLVNDREFITIQEEIDNLKHYFSIQAIRYAGSFHVNYDISQETAGFLLPKLILQPLAENSVIHGTYNDGTIMEIYVSARFEGRDILLEVQDQGKGFDPDSSSSDSKGLGGIGTRNVNDRIHLYFSSEYGLTISSAPGRGTCCRILIPAIPSSGSAPLTDTYFTAPH